MLLKTFLYFVEHTHKKSCFEKCLIGFINAMQGE